MKKPTLWMVVGVRPQYVKAVALRDALRLYDLDVRVVDTRQHYDYELNQQVIDDIGLQVDRSAVSEPNQGPLHYIYRGIDAVQRALEDTAFSNAAILVFGDANPAVVGAVAAKAVSLPLIHVEAGARRNPIEREHWNSRMVDSVSDLRFAVTQRHLSELCKEGLQQGSVLSGDLSIEWYRKYWLRPRNFERTGILVTLHRPENMSQHIIDECVRGCLGAGLPVTFVAHPRNRALLAKHVRDIRVVPPQRPSALLEHIQSSVAVLTDSGGLAREAHYLRTPVLMRRDVGGWPELLEFGVLRRVGCNGMDVSMGVEWANELLTSYPSGSPLIVVDGVSIAAQRIVEICQS